MCKFDLSRILHKLLIGIILGLLVMTALIVYVDASKIYGIISSIDTSILIQTACYAVGIYVIRFIKWYMFLRVLHVCVPVIGCFGIYLSGLSMGLTPGKVGEVLKSYLLERVYGVPFMTSAPTIIAERLTGILGCFTLCLLSVLYIGQGSVYVFYLAIAVLAILMLVLLIFCNARLANVAINLLCRINVVKKYRSHIVKFYDNAVSLMGIKVLLAGVVLSAAYWFSEAMVFYTLLQGVGVSMILAKAVLILTSISIGGGLTMLPGSVGALEGGLLGVLIYEGLTADTASCVVLLHRCFAMWLAIIVGAVVLVVRYRKKIYHRMMISKLRTDDRFQV